MAWSIQLDIALSLFHIIDHVCGRAGQYGYKLVSEFRLENEAVLGQGRLSVL